MWWARSRRRMSQNPPNSRRTGAARCVPCARSMAWLQISARPKSRRSAHLLSARMDGTLGTCGELHMRRKRAPGAQMGERNEHLLGGRRRSRMGHRQNLRLCCPAASADLRASEGRIPVRISRLAPPSSSPDGYPLCPSLPPCCTRSSWIKPCEGDSYPCPSGRVSYRRMTPHDSGMMFELAQKRALPSIAWLASQQA